VFLRWDVLHNQADRIDDMTMRITSREGRSGLLRVAASSNISLDTDPQLQEAASGRRRASGGISACCEI
jgi:hypothetical protein